AESEPGYAGVGAVGGQVGGDQTGGARPRSAAPVRHRAGGARDGRRRGRQSGALALRRTGACRTARGGLAAGRPIFPSLRLISWLPLPALLSGQAGPAIGAALLCA